MGDASENKASCHIRLSTTYGDTGQYGVNPLDQNSATLLRDEISLHFAELPDRQSNLTFRQSVE